MMRSADDNRQPGVERSRQVLKRVRLHMRFLRKLRKKLNPRVPMALHTTTQYRLMREALDRGDKIVAFDAEWQYQWPNLITELGVAIYHNGHREVHNVRVRGGAGKTDKSTRFMTDEQAKRWLASMFKGAGLLVGHAIHNDRVKMQQWGWPLPENDVLPLVDTGRWSQVMNPTDNNPQRLSTFCRNHGVEVTKSHVAGNDACMTLDVALTLARIEDAEYVRAA